MAGTPEVAPAADGPLVPLSTRVPPDLRKRLRRAAIETDSNVQAYVIAALEKQLRADGF